MRQIAPRNLTPSAMLDRDVSNGSNVQVLTMPEKPARSITPETSLEYNAS